MFFAEHYGLPPIAGRILGWLMICETPEQSAGEIAAAIGASRASLTTNMRFLTASGFVRRLTRPGAAQPTTASTTTCGRRSFDDASRA
jgi:DNA-binding transcriptional regulator GbsR (MarR family)